MGKTTGRVVAQGLQREVSVFPTSSALSPFFLFNFNSPLTVYNSAVKLEFKKSLCLKMIIANINNGSL